ncbi:MAG: GAF domain-containing protein, partial [Actinobacteria bacterium]|nr:GAF domain-containing protein [Actinomycetota bacterium]
MPASDSIPRPVQAAREPSIGPRWGLPLLVLILAALVLVSVYNYAMFHTLVELYCMIIAAGVFMVVYNTRRLLDNDYLLCVGIGFLFFVALGIPHTLGYKGLQLFVGFDNDLPTQAFIAQRFLLASTVLIAPLFLSRRLWVRTTISIFAAVTGVALLSLLVWDNFPHMFIDGVGLTPVKKALELVLCAMFIAAGMLLFRARRAFEPDVLRLLLASLGCFVGSELAFMLYATPFGLSNLGGHLLQVSAFYFAYRAVLLTALVNPFGLLFRELATSERSLWAANAQLNAVADISDTAISTLELDELLPRLLERMVTVMHADAALVLLADGNNLKSFASVGLPGVEFTVPFGSGFSGIIAETRKPRFVFDAQAGDLALIDIIREQGIQSMLGVPLSVGDKLLGVVHVDWRTHHAF